MLVYFFLWSVYFDWELLGEWWEFSVTQMKLETFRENLSFAFVKLLGTIETHYFFFFFDYLGNVNLRRLKYGFNF